MIFRNAKPITIFLLTIILILHLFPFIILCGGTEGPPLQEIWTATYDGGSNDRAYAIAIDSENNVIVTGVSFLGGNFDYYTIKYNTNGIVLWEIPYDGSWLDKAYGVTIDSEDNVIVTGVSAKYGSEDFYTIKYDGNGNNIWSINYNKWTEIARDIAVDSSDNIIIVGSTNHGGNDDYCIVKYDKDGTLLWDNTYDSGNNDIAYGVTVDSQDNIIVTGTSETMVDGIVHLIIKYDAQGTMMWNTTDDNGEDDYAYDVAVDSEDNIIVVGSTSSMGRNYYYITKYDNNGNLAWKETDTKNNAQAFGVAVDSEDNILVTGRYKKPGLHDYYYTMKYYPNGNVVWEYQYNSGHDDYGRQIGVDSEGDIIITGYSEIGDFNYYTVKYKELFGNELPEANFTYTPSSPTIMDTIQFTDQSIDPDGNITSWLWDFGDGNTSNEQNPSHQYGTWGIYFVTLTVTDDVGQPDTTQQIVIVEGDEYTMSPIANFDYTPSYPEPFDSIQFNDTSVDFDGFVEQWLWILDDNTFSTDQSTTYTFTQNGEYPITLIIMDNEGASDTITKTITVDDGTTPPVADFTYSPSSPTTDDIIQFIDQSTDDDGYITKWHWNFGDGGTSTASHPTHQYPKDDTYTVTLTVTDNDDNTDSAQKTLIVTLPSSGGNQSPIADFTFSPQNPDTTTIVHFTDESTDVDGTIISWLWDFGDGSKSTFQNPTYQYPVADTYEVTLNVTDDDGNKNFTTKFIHVETYTPPPPPPPDDPPNNPPSDPPLDPPSEGPDNNGLITTLTITPAEANGENGWYITRPTCVLSCSKSATIYYHWGSDIKKIYTGSITAPEGKHTLFYYAVDNDNNVEPVKWKTILVDTIKPQIYSSYPKDNSFINEVTPLLTIQFREEIQIMNSTLDERRIDFNTSNNKTFSHQVNSGLSVGRHLVSITARDLAGHQARRNISFVLDMTKPSTIIVDLPANNSIVNNPFYITVNASDESGIHFMLFEIIQGNTSINSSEITESNYRWFFNTSAYTEGEYILRLTIVDNAGNIESIETWVTVSTSTATELAGWWVIISIIFAIVFLIIVSVVLIKKDKIPLPKTFSFLHHKSKKASKKKKTSLLKTFSFLNHKSKQVSKKKSRKSAH